MATTRIPLYDENGKLKQQALVDSDVADKITKYPWFLDRDDRPYRKAEKDGRKIRIPLSRAVFDLKLGDKRKVFYRDHTNVADCRKKNLDLTTKSPGNRAKVTATGKVWPCTAKNFSSYARSYVHNCTEEEFFKQFKATTDDLLELVGDTTEIKWNSKRIVFRYQKGSPTWKKASTPPTSSLVERFLKDQFAWEGQFAWAEDKLGEPYRTPEQLAEKRRLAAKEEQVRVAAKEAEEAAVITDTIAEAKAEFAEELRRIKAMAALESEAEPFAATAIAEAAAERVTVITDLERTYSLPVEVLIESIVKRGAFQLVVDAAPMEIVIKSLRNRGAAEIRF